MTNNPNIKREVLEHVIDERQSLGTVAVNLREFSDKHGYEEHRVAAAVHKLGLALDYGISPMYPWPAERDVAAEWFDAWDVALPDGFDDAGWYE